MKLMRPDVVRDKKGRFAKGCILPHLLERKGKTYVELYGADKANSIKQKQSKSWSFSLKRMLNHRAPKTIFKKGMTPWNKDKKGLYSKEHINKLRLAKMGKKQTKELVDKRMKAIFKSLQYKPNKQELLLNQILQANFPNEFKFVGDGLFFIERYCPDFINCNGRKLIIELFGNYFHSLSKSAERDERKLKVYSKYGFKTLIIWQNELKRPEMVVRKIRVFMGGENGLTKDNAGYNLGINHRVPVNQR